MTVDPYDPLGLAQLQNVRMVAGYVPVSRESLRDRYPWLNPDPNPMPELVLFPRLHKAMRWFSR